MKWFVILAVFVGLYYVGMLSVSNVAIDKTLQLQRQYVDAANSYSYQTNR